MFTADEKNLEKFIDIHIAIPPLEAERWDTFFNEIVNNILNVNKELFEEEQIELLNYAIDEIKFYIKPLLVTPRLVKAFGRHLEEKVKSPANTVNIVDLFGLTVILATNPRLYRWIGEHRIDLIDRGTSYGEYWSIIGDKKLMDLDENKDKDKEKANLIIDELKETDFCNSKEQELISFIFFRDFSCFQFDYHYANTNKERRVTENQYFCNFFFRDELPEIAKPKGKRIFLDAIKRANTTPKEISNIIKDNYEKFERPDLKKIVINIINDLIVDTKIETSDRFKLLVAYGIFEKSLRDENYVLSDKKYSSNIIWKFIKTIDEEKEKKDVLIKLLDEPISDVFLASIVFYTINSEKNPEFIGFSNETKMEISDKFNLLCESKLYHNGKLVNVFSNGISDSPWQLLYRWSDSNKGKPTEKYIETLLNEHPELINVFLGKFESIDALNHLISIDKFIAILNNPKINEKIDPDNKLIVKSILDYKADERT